MKNEYVCKFYKEQTKVKRTDSKEMEIKDILTSLFDKNILLLEKYNINKKLLTNNLFDFAINKDKLNILNAVSLVFSILNNALKYYKQKHNAVMEIIIETTLLEANLMYFEDRFKISRSSFSSKDELYISNIIENNF